MRSPFDHRSAMLSGLGAGIFFASRVFGYLLLPPSAQLVMSAIGIGLMGAGLVLGIYNSIALRRELKAPTIETTLKPGEQILKIFPGGYRITRFSTSIGKWCITNHRLIYEGSIPHAFGSEEDFLIFPLRELVNVEIVEAGRFNKYLEATFKNEKVQILCKKLEDFKDVLQRAAGKTKE